jgi:hypothetical protein
VVGGPLATTFRHNAGVSNTFTISPDSVVLQPDEVTAIVNITVTDDLLPENDLSSIISADSVAGSEQINIIIVDNDCESAATHKLAYYAYIY